MTATSDVEFPPRGVRLSVKSSLRVFLSYRREDAAGHAGRLYDSLNSRPDVAQVFMDVGDIEPGADFEVAIADAVGRADIVLALIGPVWMTASTPSGHRRLDDPNDYVATEIATALERDIRVIPVLLENTPMPSGEDLPERLRPLSRRNAIELATVSWRRDVDALAASIQRLTQPRPDSGVVGEDKQAESGTPTAAGELPGPSTATHRRSLGGIVAAAAGLTVAALVIAVAITVLNGEPVRLEAEDGRIQPPMVMQMESRASGGFYLRSATRDQGWVDLGPFTIEESGRYVVEGCASPIGGNPQRKNSAYISMDGGQEYYWDFFEDAEQLPADWSCEVISARCGGEFNDHKCDPVVFTLTSGDHTLRVKVIEADFGVDAFTIRRYKE